MDGLRKKPEDMMGKQLFMTFFVKTAKYIMKDEFKAEEATSLAKP